MYRKNKVPDVKMINVYAYEMHAQPKVIKKLLDDNVVDVEMWIANKLASAFAIKENQA